jgi:hypothetical protein
MNASDDQILALLKTQSDEHKLAALLLLLKREKAALAGDTAFVRRAFNAMGELFVVRLLRTPGAPEPVDAPHVTFERIALRAAELFCTTPSIANECDLSALADGLMAWLERFVAQLDAPGAAADSAAAALQHKRVDGDVSDIVACFAGVVAGTESAFRHAMLNERLLNVLTLFSRSLMKRALPLQARVAASARRPRASDSDDDDDGGGVGERVTTPDTAAPKHVDFKTMMEQGNVRVVGDDDDADGDDGDDAGEQRAAGSSSSAPKPFEKSPHAIPPAPKPPRAYSAVCSVLDVTMAATIRAATQQLLSESGAEAVADCLGFVFAISQNVEKLHAAEQLLVLVPLLNAERVAKSITLPAAVRRGLFDLLSSRLDDELRDCALKLCALMTDVCGSSFLFRRGDDDKLVDLVIGLCAVEVRLIVEYAPLRLPAATALLGACYLLLERAMIFLADEETTWHAISAKVLGHIEQSLRDTVRVLLLALDSDDIVSLIGVGPVGYATARFLGSWLAEDAESVLPQLTSAVPALWKFAEVFEDASAQGMAAIVFLLPALQHLTADAEATRAVLANDGAQHLVRCALQCTDALQRWYDGGGVASEIDAHDFSHITPPGLFVTCAGVIVNVLVLHFATIEDASARQTLLQSLTPLLEPLQALLRCVFRTAADPMPEETQHVSAFACIVGLVLLRESRGDRDVSLVRDACQFVAQALPQREALGDAWTLLIDVLSSTLEVFQTYAATCLSTGIRDALAKEIVGGGAAANEEERKQHARLLRLLSQSDNVASTA